MTIIQVLGFQAKVIKILNNTFINNNIIINNIINNNMKITKHISFYYVENRIIYVNKIIDETNKYEFITDIFIHTNNPNLQESTFNKYTNGCIKIIFHDLSNIHPFFFNLDV